MSRQKPIRTADVKSALRARFCSPEWALFFEVGNATGTGHRRWADAVAMNLYPSRGLEVHGFEIKVSRSDWTRELKNPEKSAPVQRFCDRWWIVCPAGIIKEGELPPTWGHYEIKPSGEIRQVVAAPDLGADPIQRGFVAALLRRASKIGEDEIVAAVESRVQTIQERQQEQINREVASRSRKYEELKKRVDEFETATGIQIDSWRPMESVTAAIKIIDQIGIKNTYRGITTIRDEAYRFVDQIDTVLAEIGVSADQSPDQ